MRLLSHIPCSAKQECVVQRGKPQNGLDWSSGQDSEPLTRGSCGDLEAWQTGLSHSSTKKFKNLEVEGNLRDRVRFSSVDIGLGSPPSRRTYLIL